ncbi:MAG: hypothetical protein M1610_09795 [Nitrospirae bacterium]|nr:hypothetical protein [Nitrospirota bacterium]MDA8338739.1 hypothetical protein [Nitrospiraceae bacterium]
MNYLKWAIFIFLTFLVQTQLSIFNTSLNLAVVLAYSFALKSLPRSQEAGYFGSRAEIKSTVFGAGIGLLEDILAGSIIGPGFFSKGLIGFISVVAFTEVVFKWTPFLGVIAMIILTVIDGIIVTGLRFIFTNININMIDTLKTIFIHAIVNIPFGIIFKPSGFKLTD